MNQAAIILSVVIACMAMIITLSWIAGNRRIKSFRESLQEGDYVIIRYDGDLYEGTIIAARMGMWEVMFDGVKTVMKTSDEIYPPSNHRAK